MATHSSVLAWRIPGMGEPGGLPSLGSHRVRHNWSDLAAVYHECMLEFVKYFFCIYWLAASIDPMNSMTRQKDRTLTDELPRSVGAQYATGNQWRNNSRKNKGMEPKQKQHPVVNGTGDRSKVQCCKEQYCTGTWNVRSMNQGKLEVVKQEMARVNVDILGISELKWTGMGEFNSDDHYIYYWGQESLRRNGVAIMVNKRAWNAVLVCNLKNDRMISIRFEGKPFNIMLIQAYAPTSNAEVEQFYEDL